MSKTAYKLPDPKQQVKEKQKQRIHEIKRYQKEIEKILGKPIEKKWNK